MKAEPDSRDILLNSSIFGQLGPELNDELLSRLTGRRYRAGEAIIRQDDPGECLMVILEGNAVAILREGTETHPIARFSPGDVVGEMALLTRENRSADVVADSDVRALVLTTEDFQDLAVQYPEVGMILTNLVAERLGEGSYDGLGGKEVGLYRIVKCVGRGAMAVVYEARESATNRRVALKMMSHRLLYEPGASARFRREADILRSIRHENIALVFDLFPAYRTTFMCLELCEGPDLGKIIKRQGAIAEERARPMIGQIAAALGHLHERGIIHRDLKPDNVMSTPEGILKLTDFGLAKATRVTSVQEKLTDTRAILGTPLYMSPEQVSGEPANQSSDLYSLGCVALEVLNGQVPFSSRTFTDLVVEKRDYELPAASEIGKGISVELHSLIVACMDHDPAARTPDLGLISRWAEPIDPALLR